MKKFVLGLAIASVAGTFGVSHAAVNLEAALPGAAVNTGTGGYAFGTNGVAMVAVKAAQFTFVNLDPLASHDMVSDASGPHAAGYYFHSSLIGVGGEETVVISNTSVGHTYGFHCTLHSWMKGQLTIEA
ncbi:MAG: cupredoxin domain-containing protein [Actinomycetota bacterium]